MVYNPATNINNKAVIHSIRIGKVINIELVLTIYLYIKYAFCLN
jgi:hypothetical protein